MKKFFAFIVFASVAVASYAALDTSVLQNALVLKPQSVSAAAVVNSTSVDKMPYTGVANIVISLGVNTGATVYAQLQTAPYSTGTFANVTGASASLTGTNGAITNITYDTTRGSQYFRIVVSNGNAGATAIIGATVNAH